METLSLPSFTFANASSEERRPRLAKERLARPNHVQCRAWREKNFRVSFEKGFIDRQKRLLSFLLLSAEFSSES